MTKDPATRIRIPDIDVESIKRRSDTDEDILPMSLPAAAQTTIGKRADEDVVMMSANVNAVTKTTNPGETPSLLQKPTMEVKPVTFSRMGRKALVIIEIKCPEQIRIWEIS